MQQWYQEHTRRGYIQLLGTRFTATEVKRIVALQQRFGNRLQHVDLDLDERRLEFARWLVAHGKISEHMAPREASDTPTTAG